MFKKLLILVIKYLIKPSIMAVYPFKNFPLVEKLYIPNWLSFFPQEKLLL